MDVNNLVSLATNAVILLLVKYIFVRLIAQVDVLAKSVQKVENRLIRLETIMKIDQE